MSRLVRNWFSLKVRTQGLVLDGFAKRGSNRGRTEKKKTATETYDTNKTRRYTPVTKLKLWHFHVLFEWFSVSSSLCGKLVCFIKWKKTISFSMGVGCPLGLHFCGLRPWLRTVDKGRSSSLGLRSVVGAGAYRGVAPGDALFFFFSFCCYTPVSLVHTNGTLSCNNSDRKITHDRKNR